MPCNGCGDCCEAIKINISRATLIKGAMRKSYDHSFVLSHWHVKDYEGPRPIYGCDAFDSINRTCTVHATRPYVCSGYPFYAEEPNIETIMGEVTRFPKCGYVAEVLLDIANGG